MKTYRIVDGSYALANKAGKMEPIDGTKLFGRRFNILAFDCDLPAEPTINFQTNDTVAVDIDSGQVVFTQQRFVKKIKLCPNCGHGMNERH